MQMFRHVGLTLRLLRELRDKSQGQVAKEAGISKSQLSKYENGRLPKLETLERLLAALGVEYYQFFFTLYLVDRRATALKRPAIPTPTTAPAETDRILTELREEQAALLPAFLGGATRSDSLEQAFRKVFDELLTVYRMVFEQLLATEGIPADN